jgi:hypothetical protein
MGRHIALDKTDSGFKIIRHYPARHSRDRAIHTRKIANNRNID